MTTAGKGNLPVEYTSLAGRVEEIAEGLLGLSESRLVTVTGPGGVGKSRVATRVAHGARRRFPDGVWYAELSHVADERSLVAAVAATMGRPELTTAEEVADAFAGWRALLVLDTCEHLMGPVSRLVEAVLRGTGRTKVLAVSRVLLTVQGQRVLTVGPLPEHEALALFVERARAVDQGFELTEATRPFAEEICRSLEGVPLAIELAAGCLRSLPLAELLERMDDRWPDLAGSSTNVLARQRDLRSLVEWSHALCGAEQRVLWEALSVLSGSFPLEVAEAAGAAAGLPEADVAAVLCDLVDHSVVLREPTADGMRYRLLGLYRRVGLARLDGRERAPLDRTPPPPPPPRTPPAPRAAPLSPREAQVATLIAEGLTNLQIANRLVISKRTVDAHVRNILAKSNLASRTHVAAWVTTEDTSVRL
ncbi:ATP-binding protein [Nonomuraea dietziae]|uniref:ATP-binding protein n=1 Tax=Nonomuraea dietziae TaxID=65515 RepID=UPI00343E9123